jgi:hypothetical protein
MYSNVLQLTTVNNVAPNIFWANDESVLVTTTNGTWTTTMPITGTTYQWFTSPDGLNWSITPFTGYSADFITYNNVYVKSVVTVGTSIGTESAESNTLFTSDVYKRAVRLLLKGDGLNDAQNNTFLDSSTNNFTITRSGTVTQGSFSPYALNGVAYNPSVHGGSGYFNGSTDYLTIPANAAFNFSSRTFTIEAWVNFNTTAGYQVIVTNYNSTSTGWYLQLYLGKIIAGFSGDGKNITGTTTVVTNTWYHVAVSGSFGSYKLFINGSQEGPTYTGSVSLAGGSIGVGAITGRTGYVGASKLKGYISNLRIVDGQTLYTSNFSVPTSPVTLTSNGGATPSTAPTSGQVALLCDFTNGGIIDSTAKNDLTTVGNVKVSTSVVKYGTGSMYFDGTGDYLTIPTTVNLDVYTVFTIECWLYRTAANECIFLDARRGTNEVGYIAIVSNQLKVTLTSPSDVFYSTSTMPLNVWTHVAFVSDSSGSRIYLNGTQDATTVGVANWGGENRPAYIGDAFHLSYGYYGYMDDLRITKAAVYTSNFTPGPGSLTYP